MAAFPRIAPYYKFLSALLMAFVFSALSANGQVQLTPAQIKAAKLAKDLADIHALPECSLARTNSKCRLIIDRGNPLSPSAVQMYSNEKLTVVVKRPKPYERYFLDFQTGQATLNPDVASSIVQGLLPSLGKVAEFHRFDLTIGKQAKKDQCTAKEITDTTIPTAGTLDGVVAAVWSCLAQLSINAMTIYRELEPFVAPDSLTPNASTEGADLSDIEKLKALKRPISEFLKSEFVLSSRVTAISADSGLKATGDLKVRAADARAILELTDLQKLADAVANDLLGYSLRITDLEVFDNSSQDCSKLNALTKDDIKAGKPIDCIWITSRQDDDAVYQNMVTRTITYALNTYNLVSYSQEATPDPTKKKLLATIAINFADTPKQSVRSAFRWEAAAGAFFSSLPVRSFSAAPVFTNGVITDKIVAQNVLHPTVVPFAAGNYRLTNDLPWGRWKSNLYWTGAVGINPNTVTADFATGLSLSWRALMVSGLCHFGHDVRLTQGLTVGESFGASFNGSIPTQTYWTESFALGLSIRVPSLTGR